MTRQQTGYVCVFSSPTETFRLHFCHVTATAPFNILPSVSRTTLTCIFSVNNLFEALRYSDLYSFELKLCGETRPNQREKYSLPIGWRQLLSSPGLFKCVPLSVATQHLQKTINMNKYPRKNTEI